MDAMVSARIPLELRNQANDILISIGASPSQLIKAAYRFILETGELPLAQNSKASEQYRYSAEAQADLRHFMDATTLQFPDELAGLSLSEIRAMRLQERHGSLA